MNNQNPAMTVVMQTAMGHIASSALFAAVGCKVADKLRDGPKHVDDIAKIEPKCANASNLYRVLRALASMGIFRETPAGSRVFENTDASKLLDSGATGNIWNFIHHFDKEQFLAYAHFQDALQGVSPCKAALGTDIWNFYKEHPDRAAVFHQAMYDSSVAQMPTILAAFDFGGFKTICDVGGGKGTFLLKVLEKHHGIQKAYNYDLPEMINKETKPFLAKLNHIGVAKIETVTGSFLAADAGIPKADLYILKHIIHDWSDPDCVTILTHIRKAISSGNRDARIAIVDFVVPEDNNPSPSKLIDLHMMTMCTPSANGEFARERTATEFRSLLHKSGFELQRIVPAGLVSVIEAKLGATNGSAEE